LWGETADLGINHQDRSAVYLDRNATVFAGDEMTVFRRLRGVRVAGLCESTWTKDSRHAANSDDASHSG